jgi:hypothetical protein
MGYVFIPPPLITGGAPGHAYWDEGRGLLP